MVNDALSKNQKSVRLSHFKQFPKTFGLIQHGYGATYATSNLTTRSDVEDIVNHFSSKYEEAQAAANGYTDKTGFSREDMPSTHLGAALGTGRLNFAQLLDICRPVSEDDSRWLAGSATFKENADNKSIKPSLEPSADPGEKCPCYPPDQRKKDRAMALFAGESYKSIKPTNEDLRKWNDIFKINS
jgi:hypothetical protein